MQIDRLRVYEEKKNTLVLVGGYLLNVSLVHWSVKVRWEQADGAAALPTTTPASTRHHLVGKRTERQKCA